MPTKEPEEKARPGRKRSDASRVAVQEAVLALLRREGYAALTFDRVAAEAGVGKQTIYRWWSSKGALVLDALADETRDRIRFPDTGDLEQDLTAFLAASTNALRGPKASAPILRALVIEAQLDAEFLAQLRDRFLRVRRDALRTLLDRGVERGELAPGTDLELLSDQIYGALWYRILFGMAPLDRAFARGLAKQVVGGKRTRLRA